VNAMRIIPTKRNQVWNRAGYSSLKAAIQTQLHKGLDLKKKISRAKNFGSYRSELERFIHLVESIRLEKNSAQKIQRLKDSALSILKTHHVRPGKSKISSMYRDLYSAVSNFYRTTEDDWREHWNQILANDCDPRKCSHPSLGESEARKLVAQLELRNIADPKANEVRNLRLRGRALEAKVLSENRQTDELLWEHLCASAQLDGKTDRIVHYFNQHRSEKSKFLFVHLWAYLGSASTKQRPPVADRIIRKFILCTKSKRPMLRRTEICGEVISDALSSSDAEEAMLIFAALAKWLRRSKHSAAANSVDALYRALSEKLSCGMSSDILGVTQIEPIANFARSRKIFALAIELTFAFGRKRFRQFFSSGSRAKQISKDETIKIISIAASHLSQLKGPLMKIGQHLSYLGIPIPDEASRMLENLQHAATPAPWSEIREMIETDLAGSIEDLFDFIETNPIAMGSIGQVHRARLKTGELVAIKVQYPQIKNAIDADLQILKTILPLGRIFSPRFYDSHLIDELRRMLLSECDYLREAAMLRLFSEKFRSHDVLRFPKVYREFCSSQVLTMEFIKGMNFKDYSARATESELTRAGDALVYFYTKSFVDGFFNSDPHPGNFLFARGFVYLLDFGSVNEWSHTQAQHASKIIWFGLSGDAKFFRELVDGMKLPVDKKHFNYQSLQEAMAEAELETLLKDDAVQISAEKIRRSFQKLFGLKSPHIRNMRIPSEYIFGFRVCFSYLFMLAKLGAKVNVRAAAMKAMNSVSGSVGQEKIYERKSRGERLYHTRT
jgi:predicted unusual protein kinase regulating ubiquinone biosynthesis (AarF/ABC1/UbiB family)